MQMVKALDKKLPIQGFQMPARQPDPQALMAGVGKPAQKLTCERWWSPHK